MTTITFCNITVKHEITVLNYKYYTYIHYIILFLSWKVRLVKGRKTLNWAPIQLLNSN